MRNTASATLHRVPAPLSLPADRLPTAWQETLAPPPADTARAPVSDDRTYVYQSAWLARALATSRPKRHVDISASVCFAAIASAFLDVEFYEFQPIGLHLRNFRSGILDFDPLPFGNGSVASLSTAGIVERLDRDAPGARQDQGAMRELARVVAPDGSLLIALPVGRPLIKPASHHVYTFGQVLDTFAGFELEEFFLISDAVAGGKPVMNPDPAVADRQEHGIGCFWLRKTP